MAYLTAVDALCDSLGMPSTVSLAKIYRSVTVVTDHGAFSRTGVYRNTTVETVLAGLQTWSERSGEQFTVYSVETA